MTAVAWDARPGARPQAGAAASARLSWLRERGMGASVLVSGLSTAFGVVLIATASYIVALLRADPYAGGSETVRFVLDCASWVLIGVAVYVASIVTANTFATVVAGRTRQIALLRLIGSSAQAQRTQIARQGLVIGVIGAMLGLLAGTAIAGAGVLIGGPLLGAEGVEHSVVEASLLLPAAVVVLTTWAAAWVGSRRVLAVTPLQALGGSVEASRDAVARRSGRNIAAIVLFALGGGLLALGIIVGFVTPAGLVIAFFGGLLSFTGLVLGATLVMPPVLRLVGRAFGTSAPARLAAANALRYPERSSRMAIGVVMGVTLVTMFAVALESVKAVIAKTSGGEIEPELAALIDGYSAIMMGLVAISAVIAGVGLVNLLTLGVVQRRRELGLLRALGLSNGQVRRMVLLEATHITVAAVATGLLLGIVYGWAGAQSLLGSVPVDPEMSSAASLVWPAVPFWPVAVIVVASAVLTLVASVVPTRLATGVAPVEALAE